MASQDDFQKVITVSSSAPEPTNIENAFDHDEVIVSKTDLKGRVTYANEVFLRVAEMTTSEVLGQPHSLIRHPDMPRCVFKLLWDTISSGREIFALVKNMAKSGNYYWVLAHVTPSFDNKGNIIGYHSNRRVPKSTSVQTISGIYKKLLAEEERHTNRKDGMNAGADLLMKILDDAGVTYDEFIWSLEG